MAASQCYLWWRWWSYTFWVKLTRSGLHSFLACFGFPGTELTQGFHWKSYYEVLYLQSHRYIWKQLIIVKWVGDNLGSIQLLYCWECWPFLKATSFWLLSVFWVLESLSNWLHNIWMKRKEDPAASVQGEMLAAQLYIDWLQKVSIIALWPCCLYTINLDYHLAKHPMLVVQCAVSMSMSCIHSNKHIVKSLLPCMTCVRCVLWMSYLIWSGNKEISDSHSVWQNHGESFLPTYGPNVFGEHKSAFYLLGLSICEDGLRLSCNKDPKQCC